MKRLKHTPAPWKVSYGNNGSIFGDIDNPKHDGDSPYIGTVSGFRNATPIDEETKANAKLIAAAPQLLQTCINVFGMLADAKGREAEKLLLKTAIDKATK